MSEATRPDRRLQRRLEPPGPRRPLRVPRRRRRLREPHGGRAGRGRRGGARPHRRHLRALAVAAFPRPELYVADDFAVGEWTASATRPDGTADRVGRRRRLPVRDGKIAAQGRLLDVAFSARRRNLRLAHGVVRTVEGRPLEEGELVLRAQRGDEGAFAELVRAHQEIAFRVAYLVTGSAAKRRTPSRTGSLKAWRALRRFRTGAPFRPWLLQIVANEARNRRRSAGRRAALVLRAARRRRLGGRGLVPRGGSDRTGRASAVARGARAAS